MKRLLSLLIMFLLCQYSIRVLADNQIYLTGPNAQPGQTVELTLNLKNTDVVSAWACFLYLPEGFAYKRATLVPDRYPVDEDDESLYTIQKQNASDGSKMIVVSP